ncbi:MAG: galacturonosyltransferase [Francisella sp.]|jgi:galacturonosyltransferase
MKKILFVTNNEVGLYNFRKEVLTAFIDKGCAVTVCCPFEKKEQEFRAMGCKTINVFIDRRGKNPLTDLKLLFTYFNIINNEKPDYIFSYTIKPNLYVGLVNLLLRKKFFPNITGLGSVFANNNLLTKLVVQLYKLSFKSATKVFFQNESNMGLFVDKRIIPETKSILLPGSGVNLEVNRYAEYPKDNGMIRFIFLGRVMKEKGIYELIEAFKELSKKYNNICLDIYGFCEDDEQNLRDSIRNYENICYKGFVEETEAVIISCNAIVLPSYHEGLSNVLLEASAMGRPVIASNIPGCKETFDDGVSGFGFDPKNVEALVSAMDKFIKLPYTKKSEMGLNARKKVEKEFDRNIVINKYLEQIEG